MHQVEGLVDPLQRQGMGDHRVDLDLAIEIPIHDFRHIGTATGAAKGRTDVPKLVDWYLKGKIEIDPMITHVLTLDEINKGFDLMHSGESIRSVVVY